MFGIDFKGHPNLANLYLPEPFEGNPLRKAFPLLTREVKPWPGTVDVEGNAREWRRGRTRRRPDGREPGGMTWCWSRTSSATSPRSSVSVELETPDMTLNIGPQHPSTHGVLRLDRQGGRRAGASMSSR